MQPAFAQLAASLGQRNLLIKEGEGYRATQAFTIAADSAAALLRSSITNYPGHLPEALLCQATCAELGPILRGEKDAVQVLFTSGGPELLDHFYGDGLITSPWLAAIACAVEEVARHLPEGRGLRILEIVAGTGGLASQLLPLLERGLHSYVFSDVSAAFFPAARQKLAAYPEVECKVFDLEKPGTEQDFEAGAFDLVIGTNVVHAVSDVRVALRNIHDLLAPGGSLLFVDVATPHLWLNAVFGLTSGWWRFTDRDLRPNHPLLERSQWEKALRDSGFGETASVSGLVRSQGGESLIGLMARKAWIEPETMAPAAVETPAEKSWLVFADASGLGDQLALQLRASGVRCRVAHRAGSFTTEGTDAFTLRAEVPEDWKQMLDTCVDEAPERFVFLWSLDESEPGSSKDAALLGTDALLHLAQALDAWSPAAKLGVDLVTRGAQPVGQQNVVAVEQGPAIGLMRVVANEYPNLTCRAIDLPPAASAADKVVLWDELFQKDSEREIAFREEARYVRRIGRGLPPREQVLDRTVA